MNTCKDIGPNEDTGWLLALLIAAIFCSMILGGCAGTQKVSIDNPTGVWTELTHEETVPPPTWEPLDGPGRTPSNPVEVLTYEEPYVGYGVPEAFYEAEIDAAKGEITMRFEKHEVTYKLPAVGETELIRFDEQSAEWAAVIYGEREEVIIKGPNEPRGGIRRFFHIVVVVVIVAAGIYAVRFIRGLLT